MGSKNQSWRKSFHNGPFWIPLANELDFYWLINSSKCKICIGNLLLNSLSIFIRHSRMWKTDLFKRDGCTGVFLYLVWQPQRHLC